MLREELITTYRRINMCIAKQEKQLFSKWKAIRPGLVADGVVDESKYLASSPKLLFVLKEVNSDKGGWDLREYMRDGARGQTWDNITRWVDGIRSLDSDREILWSELKTVSDEKRMETLQSICAINLKKLPGGHTTNNKNLEDVAKEDIVFLKQQFRIYGPDIVICCGSIVSDLFHELNLIEVPGKIKWEMTQRGVQYHEFQPSCYLISYSHPEARVSDNILYYGLIDAVREIRQKKPMIKTPGA